MDLSIYSLLLGAIRHKQLYISSYFCFTRYDFHSGNEKIDQFRILVVYPFLQNYFIQGMTVGGMKE